MQAVAVEHAGMLHPDNVAKGPVSLAHKTASGTWRERSYRMDQLSQVLAEHAGEIDWYISQQRFECRRVIAQLLELGAMYVDIDYHKVPELAGMHPLGVLEDVLTALERAQKPEPTLAIFSGRGMYVIWLHEPVPRKELPCWNACQKELWRVLERFGADRGALDAARVLRIAGTVNSNSGAVVEQISPAGEVWDFETLTAEVMPMERGEVRDLGIARARRRPSERLWVPSQGFNQGTLWAGRLGDLQRLKGMRHLGDLPPGERDLWMFIAGVAMSWMSVNPHVLQRELWELAKEAARWDEREAYGRLQAIMKRAHMAARGEKIEWMGHEVDPRYHFKNQTIIDWLEITSEEEEELDVIISRGEKRKRNRKHKERVRREAGVMPRSEYLQLAELNRREVARRTAEGESASQIAEAQRISQSRVKQIRREIKESGEEFVQNRPGGDNKTGV